MGRIGNGEKYLRQFVEQTFLELSEDIPTIDDPNVIREQALAQFAKYLDGKIKNLQDGESLQVLFRVDILQADGKVRAGSGASRNMPEYITWRKAVYARDNYTCQECGSSSDINAHHIKAWSHYPNLRFDVDNGVTLCFDCHAKKHPHIKFGKRHDNHARPKNKADGGNKG